jgi:hypothetical protein
LNSPTSTNKCALNLSKHILTESEISVLKEKLNFAIAMPEFNLNIAHAVESIKINSLQYLVLNFVGSLDLCYRSQNW